MIVSRASFLKTLACVGLGHTLDVSVLNAIASSPTEAATSDSTEAQHYRAFLGSSFMVRTSSDERHILTLAQVTEEPVSRGVEQFSLIFHGAPDLGLADGIHAFTHPRLGALDLFVARVGRRDGKRSAYQACFSRHLTPPEHRRT